MLDRLSGLLQNEKKIEAEIKRLEVRNKIRLTWERRLAIRNAML